MVPQPNAVRAGVGLGNVLFSSNAFRRAVYRTMPDDNAPATPDTPKMVRKTRPDSMFGIRKAPRRSNITMLVVPPTKRLLFITSGGSAGFMAAFFHGLCITAAHGIRLVKKKSRQVGAILLYFVQVGISVTQAAAPQDPKRGTGRGFICVPKGKIDPSLYGSGA